MDIRRIHKLPIWEFPATKGYILGAATTDKYALDARIPQPDPSNTARTHHEHYTALSQPLPAPVPLVIFNDDEADDIRYPDWGSVDAANGNQGAHHQ